MEKQKDNRCFSRLSFRSELRYQLRGSSDFANAICNDISYGGLRFTTDKFLPVASPVMLEINVLNRILRPVGKVAWSMPLAHSHRNQTGIEFIEFNDLDQGHLKDFIEMRKKVA